MPPKSAATSVATQTVAPQCVDDQSVAAQIVATQIQVPQRVPTRIVAAQIVASIKLLLRVLLQQCDFIIILTS